MVSAPAISNAPPGGLRRAAVLYVFRCLVDGRPAAPNEGCLKPLKIIVPEGTFLSPASGAAVVAGNTEVEPGDLQRPYWGALGASAASQGDDEQFPHRQMTPFQYYETICGGAGAGAGLRRRIGRCTPT